MNRILPLASLIALLASLATSTKPSSEDIFGGEDQAAGLVNLTNGDDMFYWLFRSRDSPATDPLVMWLSGGPGCSSELALFFENGPFGLNDDLSLKLNPYSWNNVSNLLFVDNPIGTGFSDCSSVTHYDTNEGEVAKNVDLLIKGFVA